MRRRRCAIAMAILGLLLPLNCTYTGLLPSGPPPTPTDAAVRPSTHQPDVSHGITGAEGKATVLNSEGLEQAIVGVEDADSRLPLPGVEVYFLQQDSRYLALAVDPHQRYVAAWSEGATDEGSKSNPSHDTVAHFSISNRAYAQTLTEALVVAKAISWVSSLRDAVALITDPPNLVHWGMLYEERCWTGEDPANAVGAAGLVIPGVDNLAGTLAGEMDEIARAIFLLSQHLVEEEAKEHLLGLDMPVLIRSYHLGIPALGMVPIGWCEPEATATSPARVTVGATSTASEVATFSGPFMYGPTYSIDYPTDRWKLQHPAPLGSSGLVHLSIPGCTLSLDIRPVGTEGFWECGECGVPIRLGEHPFVRSVLLLTTTKEPVVRYDLVTPEHPEWFCVFLLWLETAPDSWDFATCRDDAEAVLATLAIDMPSQ